MPQKGVGKRGRSLTFFFIFFLVAISLFGHSLVTICHFLVTFCLSPFASSYALNGPRRIKQKTCPRLWNFRATNEKQQKTAKMQKRVPLACAIKVPLIPVVFTEILDKEKPSSKIGENMRRKQWMVTRMWLYSSHLVRPFLSRDSSFVENA